MKKVNSKIFIILLATAVLFLFSAHESKAEIVVDGVGQGALYTVVSDVIVGANNANAISDSDGSDIDNIAINAGINVVGSTNNTVSTIRIDQAEVGSFENNGAVVSTMSAGILVSDSAIVNGLTNAVNGTITTSANVATLMAVNQVGETARIESITNSGTISNTGGGVSVNISRMTVDTFTNENTGRIESAAKSGLWIGIGTVSAFTNKGTISSGSSEDEDGAVRSSVGEITSFDNSGEITAANSNGLYMNFSLVGLTNSSEITGGIHGIRIGATAELTSFDNIGGIITSTGDAGVGAGLYIQEEQDNAITNAGTIQNTGSGYALWFDTDAQTKDFTNSATGVISSVVGTAIYAEEAITGSSDGFVNEGEITGGGGTAIDAEAAFKLNNSGTITGAIDHGTAGALNITNSGVITGAITSTANTANTLSMTGGTITGDIDLGDNAGHAVTLNGGTITGNLDLGGTAVANVSIAPGSGETFTLSNTGDTALTGLDTTFNMIGEGKFIIAGNVVDLGVGQTDHILDVDAGTL